MEPIPDEPAPRAAALHHDGTRDIDALLASVAARQRRLGRRLRGVLMTYPEARTEQCAGAMVLIDLHTGEPFRVSQALGAGSRACRADQHGFARASQALRAALDDPPDLVICNRFGGLEATGGGFAGELLAIMAQGIPLLTAVATKHVDAWRDFSGGAPVLPADEDAVLAWLDAMQPARAPGG